MFPIQSTTEDSAEPYVDDVFSTYLYTGNGSTQTINNGIDLAGKGGMVWAKSRSHAQNHWLFDSARGATKVLNSNNAYAPGTNGNLAFSSSGFTAAGDINVLNQSVTSWTFRKASKFFDVVTFTATASGTATFNHALGVSPGMIFVKRTVHTGDWYVWHSSYPNSYGYLNSTNALDSYADWLTATSSQVSLPVNGFLGASSPYVAYLFASLPGVSKVGSYTGNGSSQTINCGFAAGARFILIKCTNAAGDWYVWDSARGIVAANDPHLSLNTTAAEVTTDDSVDPDISGFIVNQNTATNINVNGGSYIFLAIA